MAGDTKYPVALNFRIDNDMADYLTTMSLSPQYQGRRSEVVRAIIAEYMEDHPL